MADTRFSFAPLVLAAACLFGTTAADAATVAHYKFENGTAGEPAVGKGTILDSSGNGLDGTPRGRPKYRAVNNPDSTLALWFNGSSARMFVPDNTLFELTHSLTLEAYVYLGNDEDFGIIALVSSDQTGAVESDRR